MLFPGENSLMLATVFLAILLYEFIVAEGQHSGLILTQHPNSTNVTVHHHEDSAFLSFVFHDRYSIPNIRKRITKYYMNGSKSSNGVEYIESSVNGVPRINDVDSDGIVFVHWPSPSGRVPVRDEHVIRVLNGRQMENIRRLNIIMEINAFPITTTAITFNVMFTTSEAITASQSQEVASTTMAVSESSTEIMITSTMAASSESISHHPIATGDPLPTTTVLDPHPSPTACDCSLCTFPSSPQPASATPIGDHSSHTPLASNSRSIITGVSSTTVIVVVGVAVATLLGFTVLKCHSNYIKPSKVHPH